MKNVFLVLFFIFFKNTISAVVPPGRDSTECLAAIKNGKQFEFPLNKGIAICCDNNEKTKGILSKINGDSIVITSFNKKNIWHKTIAIKDIIYAQPCSRKTIRNNKIATMASGVIGIIALTIFSLTIFPDLLVLLPPFLRLYQ